MDATQSWPLFWTPATDSTNCECLRRIEAGNQAGFWIGADEQTHGRGRRGRNWASPPGNLMVSAVIPPEFPSQHLTSLAFVAGLSMLKLVQKFCPREDFGLKWPNDLMHHDAKLGGALVEASGDRRYSAIVGIGINLASAPLLADRKTRSLREVTKAVPGAVDAARALIPIFDGYLSRARAGGFVALKGEWLCVARGLGSEITIAGASGPSRGRFVDVADNGALVLEHQGQHHRYEAGEISIRGPLFGTV
jgi:BirA family transcriptional regulator, biotin operon repressor / biotin---[acetyl-CoA-carboxylase] ligase